MAVICPTVTASEPHAYRAQIEKIAPLSKRIHIDLMDGDFAPSTSPSLEQIWWPAGLLADVHLMYRRPGDHVEQLLKLKPHMVIVHNEAEVHHMHFAALMHRAGIKVGLAILQDTPAEYAYQIMHSFDHVLVFSGHLGFHGGKADMALLDKVKHVREHYPQAEIGWDGGVNADNIGAIVNGDVDVLNVGGYIHQSDKPGDAYAKLVAEIEDL